MKYAAIAVQSVGRMVVDRERFISMKSSSVIVQCLVRCRRSKRNLKDRRNYKASTAISSRWRAATQRRAFRTYVVASVAIQARARCRAQKARFLVQLAEAKEEAKMENQLKALKKKLADEEERRKQAEERAKDMELNGGGAGGGGGGGGRGEGRNQSVGSNGSSSSIDGFADVSDSQQMLMDESGKMLDYLRKEVFKLRTTTSQLRTENERLKENNRRLLDANAAAGASFAALNQHAKQLSRSNGKYQNELQSRKTEERKLNTTIMELKEEVRKIRVHNLPQPPHRHHCSNSSPPASLLS